MCAGEEELHGKLEEDRFLFSQENGDAACDVLDLREIVSVFDRSAGYGTHAHTHTHTHIYTYTHTHTHIQNTHTDCHCVVIKVVGLNPAGPTMSLRL